MKHLCLRPAMCVLVLSVPLHYVWASHLLCRLCNFEHGPALTFMIVQPKKKMRCPKVVTLVVEQVLLPCVQALTSPHSPHLHQPAPAWAHAPAATMHRLITVPTQ